MKILWVSGVTGSYRDETLKSSGGWVGALQSELVKIKDVKLAITFVGFKGDTEKTGKDGTKYYPVYNKQKNGKVGFVMHNLLVNSRKEENEIALQMKAVADGFRPDIIHVWGVENIYAAVIPYLTDYPVVVHIQGFTSLIKYVYLPNGFSTNDLKRCEPFYYKLLRLDSYTNFKKLQYRAEREENVCKFVKYWMGRTEWDKVMSKMLSPNSSYFHCDELVRSDFANNLWHYHFKDTIHIHSTIKHNWFKGIDVILNTAEILKRLGCKIQWNVYGLDMSSPRLRYFIKKLHINPANVNVFFRGNVNGEKMSEALLSSDVFVHPSYIENSSNAIVEAMALGVPTIGQYVGGTPSMLENESGILVQVNEPFILANAIIRMSNKETAERYSENALAVSRKRQDKKQIVSDVINVYKKVISDFKR